MWCEKPVRAAIKRVSWTCLPAEMFCKVHLSFITNIPFNNYHLLHVHDGPICTVTTVVPPNSNLKSTLNISCISNCNNALASQGFISSGACSAIFPIPAHLSRVGAAHSGLGPPKSINNQDYVSQTWPLANLI